MMTMDWDKLPSEEVISKAAAAIRKRGIKVLILNSGKEALEKIKEMIPKGAEVSAGSSTTLKEIGFSDYLDSGKHAWKSLLAETRKENDQGKRAELRRKAVTADYFLASVNAISRNGELVAADATGSRVSAYPYAAKNLILVAGAQKITPDLEAAMRRVREYVYPLEDKRARQAYGGSSTLGKWVIIEREIFPGRITLILVRERLGF